MDTGNNELWKAIKRITDDKLRIEAEMAYVCAPGRAVRIVEAWEEQQRLAQ